MLWVYEANTDPSPHHFAWHDLVTVATAHGHVLGDDRPVPALKVKKNQANEGMKKRHGDVCMRLQLILSGQMLRLLPFALHDWQWHLRLYIELHPPTLAFKLITRSAHFMCQSQRHAFFFNCICIMRMTLRACVSVCVFVCAHVFSHSAASVIRSFCCFNPLGLLNSLTWVTPMPSNRD